MQNTENYPLEIDQRVEGVEAKLAFLEHSVQQINDVVVLQQNKLDELDRTLQVVMSRMKDLLASSSDGVSDAAFSDPGHEKPPHY